MKKIKYILLLCIVLTGFHVRSQIQMRIPTLPSTVGNSIDVPVYVDNSLTGLNVVSFQLKITYNSSYLSYTSSIITGTMVSGWGNPTVNSSTPGTLNIAHAGATALTGTGILFYIRFQCIASGTSSVAFSGGTASNFFNEGTPVMTFVNGSVTISPAPFITVSPNTALLSVGETQQFTVSGGTAPYSWSLTNPATGTISSTGLMTTAAPGFTKVNVQDNGGIVDQTDGDIEIRAMKLTLPSVSEWQGGTIEIPITTTSLTGYGLLSGEIKITFNGNILTPTGYNTTGTLLQGYSNISMNNTIAGSTTFAFAGTTALAGTGILIKLIFNISAVNTGSTALNFTSAIFNETMLAKTVNGYFTMITFGNIYISPNTYSIVAGQTKQFVASGGIPPYNWSSSDNTVATVDGAGILTALKSGVIQLSVIDNVGASGTSGNISVFDTYVSLPNVFGQLGTQYDMPVLISTIPVGQSVYAVQGTISFKSPELTALDIITTGTMSDGWSFAKIVSGNTITFAGAGTVPFNSPGAMFKVRFQLNAELTNGEYAYVNINNILLNEGIPLPLTGNGSITGTGGIVVSLKTMLEGPFNGTDMNTHLNPWSIQHTQPYNTAPWNYNGSESFIAVPNANVVDWVLIELRETAGGAATATSATVVARQAALLLKNGSIVANDGISNLLFGISVTNNLYVVIWHRNHLGIMSSVPVTIGGGVYTYDFTTALSKAYLNGQKSLGGGKYGMFAGNADGNYTINATDISSKWDLQAGKSGYHSADMNLNSQVNNGDKNDVWLPNLGTTYTLP